MEERTGEGVLFLVISDSIIDSPIDVFSCKNVYPVAFNPVNHVEE